MVSVTQRIAQIKQPYGGYLPPKLFSVDELADDRELSSEENIHASLVGLCVDYLTRFMNGTPLEEAFKISLFGASIINKEELASELLSKIKGLDDTSIINACQLVGFDVIFRAGRSGYKPVEDIIPDEATILNIRIMVERSLTSFEEYGPIVKDGFTLEGGYTDIITAGDGDFLTADTLWDFKVSKTKPNKNHTLQLLIYYLMGLQSVHPEFQSIEKLGIYNPRHNKVFLLKIADIPDEVLKTVRTEVIGF